MHALAYMVPVLFHSPHHLQLGLEVFGATNLGPTHVMTPGQRLRRARKSKNLTQHQLAELTGHSYSAVRAHENGQNGIRKNAAEEYAKALGVTASFLLFGDEAPRRNMPREARMVPVLGIVQAGTWSEIPQDEPEPDVFVPFADPQYVRANNIWALEIKGTSMNLLYGPNGYVIAVDAVEAGVRVGDHVVVRRTRHGFVETTLKEVVVNDGRIELWPRSSDPAHQTPIFLGGADEVQIIGVVVGAYKKGPARTGPPIF